MNRRPPYKRLLLKLSGEAMLGSQAFGIDYQACQKLACCIKEMTRTHLEVAVVIGGGNIFRGVDLVPFGMDRTAADQMGMLATLINGIALQQALASVGCHAHLLSALECPKVAETYTWKKAIEYLSSGNVLIFVGGTGNPYFTTDTAAALRASEIHADIFLKATKVDGIYTEDPKKHRHATKYDVMSYSQVLAEKLEVIDATSIALCRSHHIPILVFNMKLLDKDEIINNLSQENMGTLVKGD